LNLFLKYLYSLVWLIGAILLIYYSNILMQYAHDMTAKTFNLRYGLWIPIIISFVFGVYMAFIHGIPKRLSLNTGTLIIFVISIVGLSCFIIPYYFKVPYFNIYFRLFGSYYGSFILGVTSGYSMITSVFSSHNANGFRRENKY
jgi:hypothetical protein